MSRDRINLVSSLGGNTGKTAGDVRMGRPKAFLFTRGKVFTASELEDSDSLKAAIKAALQQPRSSVNKLFLFDGFREAEDGTGDPNVGTMADGYEEVLNEAVPKYTLRNTKGVAQQQSLVAFNGWQDGVFVIDDKNVFWFIGASNDGGQGFSVGHLYATPPRFGNTGNINANLVKISFGTIEEFKYGVGARKLDFDVSKLANIVDVELREVGAATATVLKIGARTRYAGTDIYESYADALAQSGAWKVTDVLTGDDIPVTAAPKNAATKGWDVTIGAGEPAGKYRVELKDPAALAALAIPVEGIEGIYVNVEKP